MSFPAWGIHSPITNWEVHSLALTDTEIRRSRADTKPYKLFDGGVYLRLSPAGGRRWRWKYRFRGKEKARALGKYPEITLADARVRRDAARRALANGIDPMAERMAVKSAVKFTKEHTFEKIADLWLELHIFKRLRDQRVFCRPFTGRNKVVFSLSMLPGLVHEP